MAYAWGKGGNHESHRHQRQCEERRARGEQALFCRAYRADGVGCFIFFARRACSANAAYGRRNKKLAAVIRKRVTEEEDVRTEFLVSCAKKNDFSEYYKFYPQRPPSQNPTLATAGLMLNGARRLAAGASQEDIVADTVEQVLGTIATPDFEKLIKNYWTFHNGLTALIEKASAAGSAA